MQAWQDYCWPLVANKAISKTARLVGPVLKQVSLHQRPISIITNKHLSWPCIPVSHWLPDTASSAWRELCCGWSNVPLFPFTAASVAGYRPISSVPVWTGEKVSGSVLYDWWMELANWGLLPSAPPGVWTTTESTPVCLVYTQQPPNQASSFIYTSPATV